MKTAIVTGATGAIGVALIQKLLSENFFVYAIIHPGTLRRKNIPVTKNIKIIECDIANISSIGDIIHTKCDVFYHLAWAGTFGIQRNNLQMQINNVKYTLEAVELAKILECSVFIGIGSQAEYGRVEGKLSSTIPTFPENGYGIAKLCAGQMTRIACQNYGVRHIWVRILSVYGPYDGENSMIMSSIKKMLAGDVCQFTKGEQMWDYLYSEDAADALYLLYEKGVDGKTYCLGSGIAKPLKEYIDTMHSIVNPSATVQFGAIPYAEKQVMHLCADISELKKDTGFEPHISFSEGIKRTLRSINHSF